MTLYSCQFPLKKMNEIGSMDDLEDGEIESDEENVPDIPQTVAKIIEPKSVPKTTPTHATDKKNKKKLEEDDWATNVEHAIANALHKEGVKPGLPVVNEKHSKNLPLESDPVVEEVSVPKKRRKRHSEKYQKKHDELEKLNKMEDEFDLEYEMLNVRGGSPPPGLVPAKVKLTAEQNESEDSYTSNDSQGYVRRQRQRHEKSRKEQKTRDRRRKRDDSDDDTHRPSQPRKMELCKFYLMDCCAKREKCLYMHSDFPCKYYYLGLKCQEKGVCLFSHGKPLSDQHRVILLKHLETAPKEILGDFPRISRENALNMMNVNHLKLLAKINGTDKKVTEPKIPSLFDVITVKPVGVNETENKTANKNPVKNRKSRWCDRNEPVPTVAKVRKVATNTNNDYLSLKYLSGVISQEQIDSLRNVGIDNLDQINQLTVAQLNQFGMSINQIHELQLNAMNIKKIQDNLINMKDTDMRVTQPVATVTSSESTIELGGQDIDMRIKPPPPTPSETTTTPAVIKEESFDILANVKTLDTLMTTPTVDYSQYIKDSNLNDDDLSNENQNDDLLDDDDEDNLKINLEDEESDDATPEHSSPPPQPAQPVPQPLPPIIINPTSIIQTNTTPNLELTRSVSVEPAIKIETRTTVPDEDPAAVTKRVSIYDEDKISQNDVHNVAADIDMRLTSFLLDKNQDDDSTDVDLRLPFKPIMTHYIPATEIDGSISSHPPIVYKTYEIEIPRPDYKELRKNMPKPDRTSDPRLKRIFGIQEIVEGAPEIIKPITAPLTSPKPRLDPRRKHEDIKSSIQNNLLDIQLILQKSMWYKDLSSKHKIMVNQQLAILSTEMKKFHGSDKSADKLYEFKQSLGQNQMLQNILNNLNVYLNDLVCFCEIINDPSPSSSAPIPPPMQNQFNLPFNMPNTNKPPPSLFDIGRFPTDNRPGLLGIAPGMPFDQFLNMGNVQNIGNDNQWKDEYIIENNGSNFNPNFENNSNNNFNARNVRNNNRSGGIRWMNNSNLRGRDRRINNSGNARRNDKN